MAGTESIRTAIRDRLLTVPRIGVVHAYERYAAREAAFATLYMWQPPEADAAKELRGWFIRRTARREVEVTHTRTTVFIDWQIRGYLALQDAQASEIVMDGLVDAAVVAFQADLTLGGLLDQVDRSADPPPYGPQLVESAPYMFGGVLCHGVRLDWTTAHDAEPPLPADLGTFRIFHPNWDIPPHGNVLPPLPADDTADATDHVIVQE